MKPGINPMDRLAAARAALRCHATSKRTGERCKAPAMRGWKVCRFHGAQGGAPKGESNGRYKHGAYTQEAVALRRMTSELVRTCRANTCLGALILVFVIALPLSVRAEPLTIQCSFERQSSLAGDSFDPRSASIGDTDMELTFVVDSEVGKAYVVGNLGSAEVWPQVVEGGGIVLLEQVPSGTVQVTAIDAAGNAVHSRHSMMFGELVPSQYYGTCTFQ